MAKEKKAYIIASISFEKDFLKYGMKKDKIKESINPINIILIANIFGKISLALKTIRNERIK